MRKILTVIWCVSLAIIFGLMMAGAYVATQAQANFSTSAAMSGGYFLLVPVVILFFSSVLGAFWSRALYGVIILLGLFLVLFTIGLFFGAAQFTMYQAGSQLVGIVGAYALFGLPLIGSLAFIQWEKAEKKIFPFANSNPAEEF